MTSNEITSSRQRLLEPWETGEYHELCADCGGKGYPTVDYCVRCGYDLRPHQEYYRRSMHQELLDNHICRHTLECGHDVYVGEAYGLLGWQGGVCCVCRAIDLDDIVSEPQFLVHGG